MDLVLKKSVYLYEYIDNWQRFNEMFLPGKKKITAAWQWKISRMLTKTTRKESGESIMISTYKALLLLADVNNYYYNSQQQVCERL